MNIHPSLALITMTVGNADNACLITAARNQDTAALRADRVTGARQVDVADVDIVELGARDVISTLKSGAGSYRVIHFVLREIARKM